MVFQGEEGNKTYPLRNKGQRDWYSEIEKEESSRRPQNKERPGEERELGGRGEGGRGGSAFIVPLYSCLVMKMLPLIMTGFTPTKQPPVTNTRSFYGTNSCA